MTFKVPKALLNLVTPNKFDASPAPATTQFVKDASGSYAFTTTYAATGDIPAADAGKLILADAVTNTTLTLPAANSVGRGSSFTIMGTRAGITTTIARAGSDGIIVNGGASLTSITIGNGDKLTFTSNGGASWYTEGSAQLGYSNSFASSLATSGYQRLPSGLIIQWGGTLGVTNSIAITFPIAFPNAVLGTGYGGKASQDAATYNGAGFSSLTTTGMTFSSGTGTAGAGIRWIAIGH
jgi:hypothetical protein